MSLVLTKYIMPGYKVDLQTIDRVKDPDGPGTDLEGQRKSYKSQVVDIKSDDQIEVAMPLEKQKIILLPVDGEYDMYFYTPNGIYQCYARVADRYKSNNMYILLMDLTSNLRKYQRREYYRFSCALEMNSRQLLEEELKNIDRAEDLMVPGLPLQRSVIVDISGGGFRFVADYAYKEGSIILAKYTLMIEGESKEYTLLGKILSCTEIENRKGEFEHRVQYVNMDADDREEIIKYIFDEERKHLRKSKAR